MAVATDPRLEEIQKIAKGRGVEFFFAQFVDMYGRPSAKLIPAGNLEDLVHEGAGFAGFAAGEIGQLPSDPDIAAMPDLDSLTLVPWQEDLARFAGDVTGEGQAGALRVGRAGGGRAVAVLPADDPQAAARAREGARLRLQDRPRARV